MSETAGRVLLSARAISKRFGGVLALDDVTFDVRAGGVHGLIGANGAGKSTLIGVLSGAIMPDAGNLAGQRPRRCRSAMSSRPAKPASRWCIRN